MADEIETVVVPRTSDLGGGFMVRRALPSARRRAVGPFVFLDQMGPATFAPGEGLDVRPHPHIGLATVSYLFDGEIVHRDSLGTVMPIRAGEVNWMTAGRGIVHSERTSPEHRRSGSRLFGLQVWVALPRDHEEAEPAFVHHGADELPEVARDGARLRVIVGEAYGVRSPVPVLSAMFYVDVALAPAARVTVDTRHAERAAYVVAGEIRVGAAAEPFGAGRLLVFVPGRPIVLSATSDDARLVLLGGEPLDAPRFVWWNFVSSSRDRIEQAKARWLAQEFPGVPDETEFIPLPEARPPAPVDYP